MSAARILHLRLDLPALRLRERTPGMESAPLGRMDRAWDVSLYPALLLLPCKLGIGDRDTAKKPFGIRVKGIVIDLVGLADLHQMP